MNTIKSIFKFILLIPLLSGASFKIFLIPYTTEIKERYLEMNWKSIKRISKVKTIDFAVLGDPRTSQIGLEKIIKATYEDKNIKFSILLGDITDKGNLYEYALIFRLLSNTKKPILVIPGNHDTKKEGRAWFYHIFGPYYYSFPLKNAYFILLDISEKNHEFPFETVWLKKELKKSQNYKYKFVFLHIPPFDPRRGKNKMGHSIRKAAFAKKLVKIFNEFNVSIIFCSHIHSFLKGYWGKVPFFITGEAGYQQAELSYLHVRIENNKLKVNIKRLEISNVEKREDKILMHLLIPMLIWISDHLLTFSVITVILWLTI